MARATRTINPLHFEDLEPHRFEDLVRQLAHGFRNWRTLEATGRRGNDEGVDIRGWEIVALDQHDEDDALETPETDREWRVQVKRQRSLGPADLRGIVEDAVPTDRPPPYGLVVAAACDVSADALAALREAALARGIVEAHMWSNAHLEDALFQPENDHLLFAYFGISIAAKRRAQVAELRAILALKRKLRAAIDSDKEDKNRGLRQNLIVRDVEARYGYIDKMRDGLRDYAPPWHAVTLREIHPVGPVVERFHYEGSVQADGTWDIREDTRWWATNAWRFDHIFEGGYDPTRRTFFGGTEDSDKKVVTELRLIPWANIIDVDPAGDSILSEPHLICRYERDEGPYDGRRVFRAGTGRSETVLAEEDRRPLLVPDADTNAKGEPVTAAAAPVRAPSRKRKG